MIPARFDYYEATVQVAPEYGPDIVHQVELLFLGDVAPMRPARGWNHGAEVRQSDGQRAAHVSWGGRNQGVHVIASGDRSPRVADLLRQQWPKHQMSRIDTCIDWVEAGLFDQVAAKMIAYATANGLKIDQQGDWTRRAGRTLYLGSRSSQAQLVLYEKGYESGGDHNWVRLEQRVYPKEVPFRQLLARSTPMESLGMVPWIFDLLQGLGFDELARIAIPKVATRTDAERQRRFLVRQYGKIVRRWRDELGDDGLLLVEWDRIAQELVQES